jgi:hypothetical protein
MPRKQSTLQRLIIGTKIAFIRARIEGLIPLVHRAKCDVEMTLKGNSDGLHVLPGLARV